ncbi:hypothetical protein ACIQXG_00470 [Lysinibacillus sphaericus]
MRFIVHNDCCRHFTINIVEGVLLTAIMALLFTTMRKWINQQRTMYLSK